MRIKLLSRLCIRNARTRGKKTRNKKELPCADLRAALGRLEAKSDVKWWKKTGLIVKKIRAICGGKKVSLISKEIIVTVQAWVYVFRLDRKHRRDETEEHYDVAHWLAHECK